MFPTSVCIPVQLQGDLLSVQEDLKTTEEELEANREIIKLLQKELDNMRACMKTR